MKILEIISFMNPFSDVLSAIFITTLLIASILVVIWLIKSAKVTAWEKNWVGENLNQNNLESDNGSIHELSEAIATKAEKTAEMLPGILLVFGLLGTFLGLGLALNNASNVLVNANSTGMDGAMAELIGMMEGLGAKFKTSTWGLLCFIILSILFSVLGFDEKRLQWVIQKVRQETEKNKRNIKIQNEEKEDKFLSAITHISKTTAENNQMLMQHLKNNFDAHAEQQKGIFQQMHNFLSTQHQTAQENFNKHLEGMHATFKIVKNIENSHELSRNQFLNQLDVMQVSNEKHYLALVSNIQDGFGQFTHNQNTFMDENRQASTHNHSLLEKLITGTEKNSKTIETTAKVNLQEIQKHHLALVSNMKDGFGQFSKNQNILMDANLQASNHNHNLLEKLITKTETNSKTFENSAKASLQELQKIAGYNQATQKAMQNFVDNIVNSMSSIGTSADKMGDAAHAVSDSARELNGVVDHLQTELKAVLDTIQKNLGGTIKDMGSSFKENMESMSSAMSIATNGISTSVSALSNSVDKTLTSVTSVIGESMDLQRKSANEFTVTSTSLNEQIFEMKDLVQQLSDDISSSLKSVAEISRRIGKLTDNFTQITESNTQLVEIMKGTSKSVNNIVGIFEKTETENMELTSVMQDTTNLNKALLSDMKKNIEYMDSKQIKEESFYHALHENTDSTNKYLSKLIEWTNTNQLTVQQKVRVLDQSLEKLKRIEELSSQLVEINKKAS